MKQFVSSNATIPSVGILSSSRPERQSSKKKNIFRWIKPFHLIARNTGVLDAHLAFHRDVPTQAHLRRERAGCACSFGRFPLALQLVLWAVLVVELDLINLITMER